jgi:hypothetical protein
LAERRINLSGLWLGSFSYPAGLGPTTPFLARLVDEAGVLGGNTIEPNTMGSGSEQLEALISGSRSGNAVDFTKMYDGTSDAAHAVDYVGRLSDDGNTVSGVWSLARMDGSFEMHREAVWEEQAEAEASVSKLAPAEDGGSGDSSAAAARFRAFC